MEGFPGVSNYFDKVFNTTLKDGYILFNDVTRRKAFFDFMDQYKELKKKIDKINWKEYRREKANESRNYTYVLKPLVRKFFQMRGMIQRRSYNFPVQGTSADITKTALILMWNWIIDNDYFKVVNICNVVHDRFCRG